MDLAFRKRGIEAKLDRAKEGIHDLNSLINEFLTGDPAPYRVVGSLEDNSTKYVIRGYLERPVPLTISVRTGEVLHHLRSALDYLIGALVEKRGERQINTHQFPICGDRKKFKKAVASGQVKGVGYSAFRRIVELQPYKQPSPRDTVLSVVHNLDVRDKHRLLLAGTHAAQIGDRITVGGDGATISSMFAAEEVALNEEGVEIFNFGLASPCAHFYAEAEFATQITLENVGTGKVMPLVPMLSFLHEGVSNTLRGFDDLL